MNRVVALAVLVPLLSVAGCGGDSTSTAPPTNDGTTGLGDASTSVPTTTVATPSSDATTTAAAATSITTPDAARAAIDAEHATEAWYPRLTGIVAGTGLGAPIWFVDLDATGIEGDWTARSDTAYEVGMALTELADVDTVNIVARWSDGNVASAGGTSTSGGQLADVVALPPAPATPDEVSAWLATVYGPGGLVALGPDETWYSSITSFGTQDYGYGPELAVTTTLTGADTWQLTLLQAALQSTGMLIESAGITGGDDYFLSMAGGSFGGTMAPGNGGYMYPATA